jgi:hypothetical protein
MDVIRQDARDGKYGKHGKDGEGGFPVTAALRFRAGAAVLPAFGVWIVVCLTMIVNSIVFNCGLSRAI